MTVGALEQKNGKNAKNPSHEPAWSLRSLRASVQKPARYAPPGLVEQNGVPDTIIGAPTTGAHALSELWEDSLGAVFVCTVAGTPGTWLQIKAAPVSADPGTGTIPVGYMIWNVASSTLERHAGAYSWEVIVGGAASQKIGFSWAASH